jgi:phosphotriesterase-related protein
VTEPRGTVSAVQTVRGPVDIELLGPTLMHEHVFVLTTEHFENYGEGQWWDDDARIADAVEKLRALHAIGIHTIVDPTVIGLGRNIHRIRMIAAEVPVNIIVATGVYTYGDLPFVYAQRGPGTLMGGPDPMIADFTRDLTEGIGGTDSKAAFLKCAVEHAPMSPGVERVLRAVARTHLGTGAPVTVHTSSHEQTGRLAIDVLRQEGADLTKVVIGHAGDSNDLDYLTELADSGAILGMDRFGLDAYNGTDDRVATIVALAERGYADRMVLSHDASCFIDWFGPDSDTLIAAVMPNWNYAHISNDVLPALRAGGVSDHQIAEMMVTNPARYFTSA